MRDAIFDVAALSGVLAEAEAAPGPFRAYLSDPIRGVFLVGDDGIYIMSTQMFGEEHPGIPKPTVVYADNCDPSKGGDWYDEKRRIFGGDDGCETIGIDQFRKVVKQAVEARLTKITVRFTDKSFEWHVDASPVSFWGYIGAGTDPAKVFIRRWDGSDVPLPMSERGKSHSPTGFGWGYAGSGPAALAHSILTAMELNKGVVDGLYQGFKATFIANLEEDARWEITAEQIDEWIQGELRKIRGE